jgi:arsenite methyltransferase
MTETPRTCCSTDCCETTNDATPAPDQVRSKVREGYAEIARSGAWSGVAPEGGSCCTPAGGCCGPATITPGQIAAAVGYRDEDLRALPEGANLGLSCGNPTALASLRPGETVVDLGSGAGFDCFLAGPRVGAGGRVVGIDMTPEMLARARAGLEAYRRHSGLDNVEFRLGEIEHLPVADATADVVISNCVINLSPDKERTWREIARVLRPGGRVAVSDLALLRPLPEAVARDVEALVGCVAGAATLEDNERHAREAGLTDIVLNPRSDYIRAMTDWQDPLYKKIAAGLPEGQTIADYVTSLEITARKPGA